MKHFWKEFSAVMIGIILAAGLMACGGSGGGGGGGHKGPAPLYPALLPDTGQTACYNTTGAEIPCLNTGQDGENNGNPISYTANGDGTVTDNTTGLMWQRCTAGQNNDGSCSGTAVLYNWYEASGRYDATYNPGSNNICGSLVLGGHSDWRLPTDTELMTIISYGTSFPTIVTAYFPNTGNSFYWTSILDAGIPDSVWAANFSYGYVGSDWMTTDSHVRCVRGGKFPRPKLTDNMDGTVTDKVTSLMWQQQDDNTPKTWQEALDYCNGLDFAGHTDWRLPDIKELRSIADITSVSPAIDVIFFPGTDSDYYWSSTSYDLGLSYAWAVTFQRGVVNYSNKTNTYVTRCVRRTA